MLLFFLKGEVGCNKSKPSGLEYFFSYQFKKCKAILTELALSPHRFLGLFQGTLTLFFLHNLIIRTSSVETNILFISLTFFAVLIVHFIRGSPKKFLEFLNSCVIESIKHF